MNRRFLILLAIIPALLSACNPKNQGNAVKTADPVTAVQAPEYKKMILARVYIKPGKETDFIAAARSMVEESNKEPGCESYTLYQDPYEKGNFIVVETYKNQAAVDAHFSMPYFKDFGPKISDMTSKPIEIKILDICGEK